MEVDEPQAAPVEQPSAEETRESREMERAIADLGELLERLETNPDNIPFLRRQVDLMRKLQMTDEVLQTVMKMSELVMLSEDEWLSHLDDLLQSQSQPLTLEGLMEVFERYLKAEDDYLSITILSRHIDFVLRCAGQNPGLPGNGEEADAPTLAVDDEVRETLTPDTVRGMLQGILGRGAACLADSHLLWSRWRDWEMSLLQAASGDESSEQIDRIHELYLQRMATPHLDIETTSSSYSHFVSEYCPNEYEQRLVAATEASHGAKIKMSTEKRYGKTREDLEQELAQCASGDVASRGQVFASYISWETDPRARTSRKSEKTPSSDPALIRSVFERAIAMYAQTAAGARASIAAYEAELSALRKEVRKNSKKSKGRETVAEAASAIAAVSEKEEQIKAVKVLVRQHKESEAGIWLKYIAWSSEFADPTEASQTHIRATRACPQSSSVWTKRLLSMERDDAALEELTMTYESSLRLGLLAEAEGPLDSLVDIFVYRAAYESRVEPAEAVEGEYHPVMKTIMRGLEAVAAVNKFGDSSLKLEKFLLDWAETRAPQFLDQALAVIDKPNKSRAASYQFVLLRAGIETRRGEVGATRQIFLTAMQRSDLDWPEAIFDAFVQFENVHGDLETLLDAQTRTEKEQEKLARRREKQAQEQLRQQYQQYQQYAAAAAAVDLTVSAVPGSAEPAALTAAEQTEPMVVDASDSAAIAGPPQIASAAIGVGAAPPQAPAQNAPEDDGDNRQKRDRENSTVLVSGLPKGTEAARIESFFEDCGRIRETTILSEESRPTDSALVEFRFSDDVALALAKDRKKIAGAEVHVSMLWRSTLFVNNFSKDWDDEQLRAMFAEYGHILQTRWPSRKYADSRRFCYITMESPAAAQNALALHGMKNKEGFPMNVLISDPAARTKRVDASNSTLFVGGLNSKTTEEEVRELFQPYGTVKTASLGMDRVTKVCKGFAFVEMSSEAEAQAALALQGAHFNGRFLKVEVSDPSHSRKKSDRPDNRPARNPGPSRNVQDEAGEAAPTESYTDRRAKTVRLHNVPEGTQEGLLQQALEKLVPVKRLEMFAKQHEAVALLEHAADAGKLLLRAEPFVFQGASITFTEATRRAPPPPSQSTENGGDEGSSRPGALAFAPRASRRGGKALGKGRQAPAQDKSLPPSFVPAASASTGAAASGDSKTPDDFRLLIVAKNQQRQDNLAKKRSAPSGTEGDIDPQDSQQAKKPRSEGENGTSGEA